MRPRVCTNEMLAIPRAHGDIQNQTPSLFTPGVCPQRGNASGDLWLKARRRDCLACAEGARPVQVRLRRAHEIITRLPTAFSRGVSPSSENFDLVLIQSD